MSPKLSWADFSAFIFSASPSVASILRVSPHILKLARKPSELSVYAGIEFSDCVVTTVSFGSGTPVTLTTSSGLTYSYGLQILPTIVRVGNLVAFNAFLVPVGELSPRADEEIT